MKRAKAHDGGPHAHAPQHRVRVAVRVTYETVHDFYAATTGDLSYGGVFIATEAPPAPGTDLTITMFFPGGRRVEAEGRVRWVRTPDLAMEDRPAGCGVAWSVCGPSAVDAIERFLEDSHSEPLAHNGLVAVPAAAAV
jgi:uncharacterized protein (TIGR02266 family)